MINRIRKEIKNAIPRYSQPSTLGYKLRSTLGYSHRAVGYAIATFVLVTVVFSFLWAVIYYEVFPQMQVLQISYFPNAFDAGTLQFFNQLVFWFPLAVLWSATFYLWNSAQRRRGPEDLP